MKLRPFDPLGQLLAVIGELASRSVDSPSMRILRSPERIEAAKAKRARRAEKLRAQAMSWRPFSWRPRGSDNT